MARTLVGWTDAHYIADAAGNAKANAALDVQVLASGTTVTDIEAPTGYTGQAFPAGQARSDGSGFYGFTVPDTTGVVRVRAAAHGSVAAGPWVTPVGQVLADSGVEQALAGKATPADVDAAVAAQAAVDSATYARGVSVTSKGALGNGVADDTAAIHAARDSAATFGAEIYVPDGTYLVSGLGLSVANQKWTLASRATIKMKNAANSDLLTITANGVSVSGGTLDGNRTNQTAAGYGFTAIAKTGITIKGVTVKNTRAEGVYFSGCSDVTIDGNTFTNCAPNGNRKAIALTDIAGSYSNVKITNNTIDGTASLNGGVVCQSVTAGNTARDITISGNTIRVGDNAAARLAIEAYAATDGTIAGIVVAGNSISAPGAGTGAFGISLGGVATTATTGINGAVVSGNMVRNCRGPGIEIIGRDVSATGNVLDSCGRISIAANDVSGGIKGVALVGNTTRDCVDANYAIQLNSTSTNPQYGTVVVNNVIENPASIGIDIVGKFYDGIVAGNVVRSPGGVGVVVNAAAEVTGTRIAGNRIDLSGAAANSDGILVASSAAADLRVEDNTVTSAIRYGIYFSAAVNRCVVRGNKCSGGVDGIRTNGGDRFVIAANYCHHNSGRGISLSGSPTLTTLMDNVAHDNAGGDIVTGGTFATVGLGGTTGTTAPAAGGAGALPATPLGYLTVSINGTSRQVPFYA